MGCPQGVTCMKKEEMKKMREEIMRMATVYGPPERLRRSFGKGDREKDYPENHAELPADSQEEEFEDFIDYGDVSMNEVYGPPEFFGGEILLQNEEDDYTDMPSQAKKVSCPYCGKIILHVFSYCPYCGKRIIEEAEI